MTATHLLRPVPPRNTIPEIMRLLPDAPRVRQLRHWLGIELTHTFFQNATAMPYGSGDEVDLARAWYFAEASLLAYFTEEDTRAADPLRIGAIDTRRRVHDLLRGIFLDFEWLVEFA